MKKIGFIGYRGMVGAVFQERFLAKGLNSKVESFYFSTSQVGQPAPKISSISTLLDAYNIEELCKMEVLISCQGGDYTTSVFSKLIESGWKGKWIDAASTLRMSKEALIVLDPLNRSAIDKSLDRNQQIFVGGNCTVSLLLLALDGLLKNDLVEWVSSMTYQAASGAGAKHMKELLTQMGSLYSSVERSISGSILEVDRLAQDRLNSSQFPTSNFGYPLAASVLPWIDTEVENGQSREEWKAQVEANKILETESNPIIIDGTCVRVGSMRSHAQGLTIKLKKDIGIDEINSMLVDSNEWLRFVENNKADSLTNLTPASISGTLDVAIGRVRKSQIGSQYLNAFTVGDQLLWGAAEPLVRMLEIILER